MEFNQYIEIVNAIKNNKIADIISEAEARHYDGLIEILLRTNDHFKEIFSEGITSSFFEGKEFVEQILSKGDLSFQPKSSFLIENNEKEKSTDFDFNSLRISYELLYQNSHFVKILQC